MPASTPNPSDLPPFLRDWLDTSENDGAPCEWFVGEPTVVEVTRADLD